MGLSRWWGAARSALRAFCSVRPRLPVVLAPGSPPVFPPPSSLPADGLVAVGGDLSVARLLAAYRTGIFPWFEAPGPILWWCPCPRAIFALDGPRVSRRLARTVRSGRFRASVNAAFASVVRGCADRAEGTWITAGMAAAYEELHRLGHAHSVEVWHGDELAGGVYGVTVGGLFAGESMFSRVRDASKVALVHLTARLRECGFTLFDIQFRTDHTASLGAVEVSRGDYLARLAEATAKGVRFA